MSDTKLMLAVKKDDISAVKRLLEVSGTNVNYQDAEGGSTLMVAATNNQRKMV